MMRVFYGFNDLPKFVRPAVTVGSFDGLHAGHRKLIAEVVAAASKHAAESVVITFSPHPRVALGGQVELLNTVTEKIMLFESVGVDNLIIAPFTKEFAALPPEKFVEDYLICKVGVSTLVVGYDHGFGSGRKGDFEFLKGLQQRFGFDVKRVERHDVGALGASSTAVRRLVEAGRMDDATEMLCAPYPVFATVEKGRVVTEDESKLMPADGVYKAEIASSDSKSQTQITISNGRIQRLPAEFGEGAKAMIYFL